MPKMPPMVMKPMPMRVSPCLKRSQLLLPFLAPEALIPAVHCSCLTPDVLSSPSPLISPSPSLTSGTDACSLPLLQTTSRKP